MASIIILLVAKPTPKSFLIGLPFVIVGEAIRIWASGYLSKLKSLITAGPFAICRNPLYIGSFLISLGYFIMCNQPIVWIAGPILFWLFHGGAISYEERLLANLFGDEFNEYCKTIPRLISFPRSLAGHGEFSIRQVVNNNEHRGALITALALALYAILAYSSSDMPISWLISRL
ncbi:isoprenylcysteine carboxylmethyltransferase family protein [bacterium]|nr:isoprenylcysteine carboxylmethyltransferase family protein [bacterium]